MEINTLISRYISGEATLQEKAELDVWRKANEANEKEFQELAESWSLAHAISNSFLPTKKKYGIK